MDTYVAIIAGMAIFGILAAGFILFIVHYQRRVIWQEKELHKKELKYQEDLIVSNMRSVENERRRIARDIHDELGNIFATLHLHLDSLSRASETPSEVIQQSKNLVGSGIENVRRIAHSILPNELELFGLQHALEDYFHSIADKTDLALQMDIFLDDHVIPEDIALPLYRITLELVTNTLKYAHAKQITFQLNSGGDRLEYYYKDDGVGADLNNNTVSGGIGLQNIRYRCIAMYATLAFSSAPGKGFSCSITIPNKIT
ncbi:MAG: histidine kinase [Chitinophagales bacterium]